jgi:phage tail protein X
MITYKTKENDVIDWICWKHYGFTCAVEEVLKVNPEIAEYDDFLPEGLIIKLPQISREKSVRQIRLWD